MAVGSRSEFKIRSHTSVTSRVRFSHLHKDTHTFPNRYSRAYEISKVMMIPSSPGDEISFDFDMLIYKPALSATETPWHQDEAYWPSQIPDKQAITVWTALDRSTKENGAMWFVPKSHLGELHEHESAGPDSHVLKTKGDDINEHEAECVELEAGDAVF